ncbi:hypothetical protein C0991_010390 [Blastosporella zonata]|nr:hypothetical protein C0991_010390 [Blastosporella zonata]
MYIPFNNHKKIDVDSVTSSIDLTPDTDTSYLPRSTPNTVHFKASIADLVAKYGSSSATAWLEFDRYHIWRPDAPIPESEFVPVQGYMRHDPYVFAWGNPLVSSPAALHPTALAFTAWVEQQGLRLTWSCVDRDLEEVLAQPPFNWSIVNCIYEDRIDPAHVLELTSPAALGKHHGASIVKDLKKNLRRAQRANVHVTETRTDELSDNDKSAVERGILEWRKTRSGVQIASSSLQPWLDSRHRRYWLARHDGKPVGCLILTPVQNNTWQIKNTVSFPDAPRGTSETLIFTALADLYNENPPPTRPPGVSDHSPSVLTNYQRTTLTFGITASNDMHAVQNLSGWKTTMLTAVYGKVANVAGLLRRGEFRKKFKSEHEPMYVCYPQEDFTFEGINTMLKLLKK